MINHQNSYLKITIWDIYRYDTDKKIDKIEQVWQFQFLGDMKTINTHVKLKKDRSHVDHNEKRQ